MGQEVLRSEELWRERERERRSSCSRQPHQEHNRSTHSGAVSPAAAAGRCLEQLCFLLLHHARFTMAFRRNTTMAGVGSEHRYRHRSTERMYLEVGGDETDPALLLHEVQEADGAKNAEDGRGYLGPNLEQTEPCYDAGSDDAQV